MQFLKKLSFIGICDDWSWVDGEALESESEMVHLADDYQVILEFLYQKHFNKSYDPLGWMLLPGAKEFVKDFDDKWFHNQIDEFAIEHDPEFTEFVKDYVAEEVVLDEDTWDELLEIYIDFVKDELAEASQKELKELYEDLNGNDYLEVKVFCPELETCSESRWVSLPDLDKDYEED